MEASTRTSWYVAGRCAFFFGPLRLHSNMSDPERPQNVDQNMLLAIIFAANYMDIKSLLDASALLSGWLPGRLAAWRLAACQSTTLTRCCFARLALAGHRGQARMHNPRQEQGADQPDLRREGVGADARPVAWASSALAQRHESPPRQAPLPVLTRVEAKHADAVCTACKCTSTYSTNSSTKFAITAARLPTRARTREERQCMRCYLAATSRTRSRWRRR